jgi:predicted esterase
VRAARLILWGGDIPPDLDLSAARERFAQLDLTLVAGTGDQFITGKILERERQRLEAHAIPFRVVRFAGGHEIDPATLRQVVG